MKDKGNWEGMGAASGLLAAVMLVLGFVIFLTTNPTGSPPYPSIGNAEEAPAYIAQNLNAYRLDLLFVSLGLALFLWFAGSLHVTLRGAEGEPGRGSTLAVLAAGVGTGLMLLALVFGFTSGLATSPVQADSVPTFYVAGAQLFATGGGVLALFFFAVAKVILQSNAMARWLGVLAFIAAVLCLLAFLTPFFDSGVLNAATGVLGFWIWYAAFVVWVFLASLILTLEERRVMKETTTPDSPEPPISGKEGAV